VTLWRQTAFALHSRLKVDGSRVLLVQGGCSPEEPGDHAFRESIAVMPGVEGLACSSSMAFNDFGGNVKVAVGGRSAVLIRAPIGFGYLEFYRLKPLAGRFLADGRGSDGASAAREATRNPSVLINESALRRLGFQSAAAAVGQRMTWTRPAMVFGQDQTPNVVSQSEIVGVAPDVTPDARPPVPPRVLYYEPLNLQLVHIRLNGRRIPETLAAIDKAWTDTGHAVIHRRLLDQTLQDMYADVIVQSTAIGVGAGLALVIAALGLLGLAAHAAEQRTKEIGVRKAMGASTADIVRLLLVAVRLRLPRRSAAVAVPGGGRRRAGDRLRHGADPRAAGRPRRPGDGAEVRVAGPRGPAGGACVQRALE
jgi:putative ABC transport system permease protein